MMARSVRWALAAGGLVSQGPDTVLTDSGSDCRYLNEVITTRPVDALLAARAARFYPPGRPFVVLPARRGRPERRRAGHRRTDPDGVPAVHVAPRR
jgi:hypothetical protein